MTLHVLLLLLSVWESRPSLAFDSLGFKENQQTQEPWFSEKAVNVTVAEGRTATLPCTVENLSSYKLAWIHKDLHILLTLHDRVITHNPRISIHHSNFRSWTLEIRDVKLQDRGAYMCQVNTNPMISQTRHLEVVVPPSIDEENTSSDISVREGADVSLQCQATGSPKPTITWTREEQRKDIILGPKRVSKYEGEVLKIKRTSRLSMGAYLCIASNGVLPSVSKRIMLSVLFAPMILIPSQLIGASIGEDVALVCNLESHPRSVTYWVISGGIVIITNNKYRVTNEPPDLPAAYKIKLQLVIRDLRPQDFGSYTCVAKNSLGETQGTIVLYEKPRTGTTEEYMFEKIDTHMNEVTRDEIRPIADNIKLERKEQMEDTRNHHVPLNTHMREVLKEVESSSTCCYNVNVVLVILCVYSAHQLIYQFFALRL